MLTESEWEDIYPLLREDKAFIIEARRKTGLPLAEVLRTLVTPACQRYLQLTGFRETNPNAIYHHRASLFGKDCPACGVPFRTPQATVCANCWYRDQ